MKKFLLPVLLSVFIGLTAKTYATKYYVYDGTTFNVMLTCDDANTVIQKVSFSANNKWNEFAIVCSTNLSAANGSGFVYTVQDFNGVPFTILYFRNKDNIRVTNAITGDVWTLTRRTNVPAP
jgi:hypothetical protein